MASMVNSVMLIGIPSKPEEAIKYNKTQVTFTLRVTEHIAGKTIETDFLCVASDRQAERAVYRIEEGKRVAVEGRLRAKPTKGKSEGKYQQTYVEVTDFFIIDK